MRKNITCWKVCGPVIYIPGRQIFKITSFTYLNICTLYAQVVLFSLFLELLLPKHSLSLCPHLVLRTVVRNSHVQIPLAQTIEMLLKICLLYHSDSCINFSMKFSMKIASFLSTCSVPGVFLNSWLMRIFSSIILPYIIIYRLQVKHAKPTGKLWLEQR